MFHAVQRISAMAAKESAHIRRDPQTLAMALAMPVGLLLLFGYGVTFDLSICPSYWWIKITLALLAVLCAALPLLAI